MYGCVQFKNLLVNNETVGGDCVWGDCCVGGVMKWRGIPERSVIKGTEREDKSNIQKER